MDITSNHESIRVDFQATPVYVNSDEESFKHVEPSIMRRR